MEMQKLVVRLRNSRFLIHVSLIFLLVLGIARGFSQAGGTVLQQRTSPNIILIIADDLGYNDVGFNGGTEIPTPHIDRIAKSGVTFTNGYVSYAVCGPSRAGIITGRYQDRFGFSRNPLFAPNDSLMGLPPSEETLAEALKKGNYKSVAIGKWHLGAHPSQHPLKAGFNDFFGFLSGGHQYFPENWDLEDEFEAKTQYDGYRTKLLRNHKRVDEKEYLTDALSREAVQYIDKYHNEPFFIYLAYNAPHAPMQATEKYLSRFDHIEDEKRRTYAAMVSAIDDGVGAIFNKLNELGIEEETIILFLSDNGGPEKVNASNNDPLRGQKGDLFEGGIKVPFAMMWKGVIPEGIKYHQPVISLDIFATVIAQTSTPISTDHPLDGVNLIPYLTGGQNGAPHDFLFWRKYDDEQFAYRSLENKYLVLKEKNFMFGIASDIGETQNVYDANKADFQEALNVYRKWESEMSEPLFLGLRQNDEYQKAHPDRFHRKTKGPK